jgi:hypothetical protein
LGRGRRLKELLGIEVDPSVRVNAAVRLNAGTGRRLRCTALQREALRAVYQEDVELWETVVLSGGLPV